MRYHPPMYRETLITPPSGDAIDLAAVKTHLRVTHDSEDALIRRLTGAAAEYVEDYTRQRMLSQVVDILLPSLPPSWLTLPLPLSPVISVDAVAVYETLDAASETVLDATRYRLLPSARGGPTLLVPTAAWPGTSAPADRWPVRVRVTAGHAAAGDIPLPLQQAMLLLIGSWFERRGDEAAGTPPVIQAAAEALMAPHRLRAFGGLP